MSAPGNNSASYATAWSVPVAAGRVRDSITTLSIPEVPSGTGGGVGRLLPLPFTPVPPKRSAGHTEFLFGALWPWPMPVRPVCKLSCVSTMPSLRQNDGAARSETAESKPKSVSKMWEPLVQFWRTAPTDLRWLAISLPVILLIVLYSTTKSATHRVSAASPLAPPAVLGPPSSSPSSSAGPDGSPDTLPADATVPPVPSATPVVATVPVSAPGSGGFSDRIRSAMAARAAFQLREDFHNGLGAWSGRSGWSHSWSYDPTGFVRTGALALLTPTLSQTDYHLEFLAQVESKGFGWVYRAENLDNYYASHIVLGRRNGQPSASIVRYAVIHGRETNLVELPLPLPVQNETVYRVSMDVQGNGFTTSVQGQVVDYWSDNRLTHGGVGFFSGRGEVARLSYVEVTHQVDALGRLCAVLAPSSSAINNNGSQK